MIDNFKSEPEASSENKFLNEREQCVADEIEVLLRQIKQQESDCQKWAEISIELDHDEDANHLPLDIKDIEQGMENLMNEVDFEYKKRAVEYWRSGSGQNRTFTSVKTKFRKLTSDRMLRKWAKQVDDGHYPKWEAIKIIERSTFDRFLEERAQGNILHDYNLQRIMLEEAKKINFEKFKASQSFVDSFKQKFKIVSRKVTKFVTRTNIVEASVTQERGTQFVHKIKLLKEVDPRIVLVNLDQSGLQLEMTYGRTLAIEGEVKIHGRVQRMNPTTHSFTITPMITSEGLEILTHPFVNILNIFKTISKDAKVITNDEFF